MIIKKIAFGDVKEAFIEDRLINGVNIIYSNDNNKGKTLVFQGLMYSLGNEPIFPAGFNYKDFYFYSKISLKNIDYEFLRYHDTFIILSNSTFQICDGESELKYFVHKNIFELPIIEKKDQEKIVDLQLFYQIFFVGQDKRNPSNVIQSGYYNKNDFMNMLSSFNGYPISDSNIEEIKVLKSQITEKQSEINRLRKLVKISKENPVLNEFVNEYADKESYQELKVKLLEHKEKISNFKKKRDRETNRVFKLKSLIGELNSLNQKIEIGKIVCADCGSSNILYVNSKLNFDVSNIDVRNQIINSIKETIEIKEGLIKDYHDNVHKEQFRLKDLLKHIPIDLQNILIYSDEIKSVDEYTREIFVLQNEVEQLKNRIESTKDIDLISKEKKTDMQEQLIEIMNKHYREITNSKLDTYSSIFTKNDETFSGSDEQEFYYCKLLSLNEYFKHDFPIIIDSFRNGELSTPRENKMLDGYKKINKQVLLSATLKTEEYENLKYHEIEGVNAIDYSEINERKILSSEYANDFKEILIKFKMKID